MKKLLMTGGTGFIGKKLSKLLLSDHEIHILSRKPKDQKEIKGLNYFYWDPYKKELDEKALERVDSIIHLVGAGIADSRWTEKRKKILYDSRILSTRLLLHACQKTDTQIKNFISSSAIGIYGIEQRNEILDEDSPLGKDYLSDLCTDWEKEAFRFEELGTRVACVRTGLVLGKGEGLLERLEPIVKLNLGNALGNGKQNMPWIHIDDLCKIYSMLLKDSSTEGVYNAVAPQFVSNNEFMIELASAMNRKILLPNVPAFVLKALFGEMAGLLIRGNKILPKRILDEGFEFSYSEITQAFSDLYK